MRIRAEAPADWQAIAELTEAAFGRPVEARLVEAIRSSQEFVPELSLVAEQDGGGIVGHAMLSYVRLEERERLLMLAPLSVLPEAQGHGTGSALVRELLARAERLGEPLVLVVGHAGYYPRFGFRRATTLGLKAPIAGMPDEAFMAIPLAGYEPRLRGRVILPPAFAEVG
jgi:putative acetyltransferase